MSLLTSIYGFFTGKSGEKIVDMADDAVFTAQEKAVEDTKQTAEVLANTSIDIFNRLVRPFVTIWLIGGFSGWWKLPDTTQLDPVWFQIFMIVITFWFGGRVLLKDLPNAVAAILKMRKG
jgi:hypothetical protein